MDANRLGPNGAQIACADMIALNTEDVKKSINSFKSDYILLDTPGQLELFVFRESKYREVPRPRKIQSSTISSTRCLQGLHLGLSPNCMLADEPAAEQTANKHSE
jgi:hypothetical protein